MAGLDHLHRLLFPGLHAVVYKLEERYSHLGMEYGQIPCTAFTITIDSPLLNMFLKVSDSPKHSSQLTLDSSLESLNMMGFFFLNNFHF